MSFELPRSLSPSKVNAFCDCALAFRFTAIERLPEPPSVWTVKGTLVHRALERLFWYHPQGARSPAAATAELARAWDELRYDPEFALLGLGAEEAETFRLDAATLLEHYFELEDPNAVVTVGVEITLEAMIGGVRMRGIIDRLDLGPDGELLVVDYKTGRAPAPSHERSKLTGVHLYALLCEEVLGRPPAEVRLLHLREPLSLTAEPSEQALRGHRAKTGAVWSAIERACRNEDFRPKPSALCNYCRFREFCPAFGGDPAQAAAAFDTVEGEVEAVA
ncbi:MAG: PD-(D/E)XK nuclease family protein [Acidimicrobiales bacterium]